jgi:hypothetical protein
LAKITYRAAYGRAPLPEDVLASARQSTAKYFRQLIEQAQLRGEVRQEIEDGL